MFLALDESMGGGKVTIGCLCFPLSIMPKLEAEFIANRISHKVWAEIKWSRLCTPYVGKYKAIVDGYMGSDQVTFHSWTYDNPTSQERNQHYQDADASKIIYRHAYLLIRSVIWKHYNNGYRGSFYILADETGQLGKDEYKITQDLLKGDGQIRPPAVLEFCNTGSSTSCGAMQVADLLTGAVMSHYDEKFSKQDACKDFVGHLTSLNKGVPLNFASPSFPKLKAQKMHHCLFKPRGV